MAAGPSSDLDVLLLGIDGASWSVLEPLFDAGCMPHLKRIVSTGVAGELTSQLPPWTPSAWPSLYTGVNPGKHGTFDFLAFDGYDWDIVDRTEVREHALWELLSSRGTRSVVVNVPVTAPVRPFDGALVPGYVGPEDPPCHPPGLLQTLREETGAYRVYKPTDLPPAERVQWYIRLTEMRGRAFRYLAAEFEPSFGFLQFQQTDTVFHEMPDDRDAVRAVFEAVDRQVGAVLEAVEPDTVLLVSDHGIGPYGGPEFRVNQYLRDRGLIDVVRGEGSMPSWSALSRARRQADGTRQTVTQHVLAVASRIGITSQRLGRLLGALGLREFVLDHVSTDTVRAGTERVDFAASRAYMRSRTEMGVRINLAGRDPEGTVAPAEYGAVRESLIDDLSSLTGPDGAPVFEAVLPVETVFDGPYVDEAVDVLTVPRGFDVYLADRLDGGTFGEPSEPWNHKQEGVIAATGDGIDAEAPLVDAHLFDVAPTVCSLLGVPPSDRMDGRPLAFVEPIGPAEYPPFEPVEGDVDVDASVEEHLVAMGYIEGGAAR